MTINCRFWSKFMEKLESYLVRIAVLGNLFGNSIILTKTPPKLLFIWGNFTFFYNLIVLEENFSRNSGGALIISHLLRLTF